MSDSFTLVLTTLPTLAVSRRISVFLLKKKLAACVNVLGPAQSSYWWKGKIENAKEYLLLIKTRTSYFTRLKEALEKTHPYSVPEILALSVKKGNPSYLKWLGDCLDL